MANTIKQLKAFGRWARKNIVLPNEVRRAIKNNLLAVMGNRSRDCKDINDDR